MGLVNRSYSLEAELLEPLSLGSMDRVKFPPAHPRQLDVFRVITYILKWETDPVKLKYESERPMLWRDFQQGDAGIQIKLLS